ncbi:MAG: hypothetical protein M3Q07_16745 [Pseudobdellovibrionaceae bacterium]|nr:hypothetical protein [Pseudobdellovibrionaceae bacterium]
MQLKQMFRVFACLTGVMAGTQAMGLDLNVSDYYYSKDLGLFFNRPDIGTDTVYYIPQTQETLRDMQRTVKVNDTVYNVWEVSVSFPATVDLDQVKQNKPVWANAGFLRTDVEALQHCEANRSADPGISFVQKVENAYKRIGLISSSEVFLCKVTLAVLPGDTATLDYLKSRAAAGSLVARGLAPFKLTVENQGQDVDNVDLAPSHQSLKDKAPLLRSVSREAALVAIGSSFKNYDNRAFESILRFVSSGQSNDLLGRYFIVEGNKYTLKPTMTQNLLKLTNDTNVEVNL